MKKLIAFAACVWGLLLFTSGCGPQPVEIYYVHENPCESCHEFENFVQWFKDEVTPSQEVRYNEINLFHEGMAAKFTELCQGLGIDEATISPPVLIIGKGYLSGEEAIRSGAAGLFESRSGASVSGPGEIKETNFNWEEAYPADNPDASRILSFVTSSCGDCQEVKSFLQSLPRSCEVIKDGRKVLSDLEIIEIHVGRPEGFELLRACFREYRVPEEDQAVPVIFYNGGYIQGAEEITGGIESVIQDGRALGFEFPENNGEEELTPEKFLFLFAVGLIGGVNPCSISMLLLLMSLLIAKRRSILPLGMAFLASKFTAYTCIGFFFYSVFQLLDASLFSTVQSVVKYLLAAVAFGLAAGYGMDFFSTLRGKYQNVHMQLPSGLRKLNRRFIERAASVKGLWLLVVFLLGLVVSAGEFLCTGQVYLASILYLAKSGQAWNWQLAGAFFCYVGGSILPSAVLVVLVCRGKRILALSELARKRMPVIKLVTAVFFLLAGVLAIVNY